MFKGDIYSITDFDEACRLSMDAKHNFVLAFTDQNANYFGTYPIHTVSYLLPPYEACEAENLGYWEDFYSLYYNHLNNDSCQSYIASMFAAMIGGRTVFCYVPEDEMILEFFPAFADYMENVFGLTIGNAEQECMFNTQYTDRVRDLVVRFGYVDPYTASQLMPSPSVLDKPKVEDNCPFTYVIPPDAV